MQLVVRVLRLAWEHWEEEASSDAPHSSRQGWAAAFLEQENPSEVYTCCMYCLCVGE